MKSILNSQHQVGSHIGIGNKVNKLSSQQRDFDQNYIDVLFVFLRHVSYQFTHKHNLNSWLPLFQSYAYIIRTVVTRHVRYHNFVFASCGFAANVQ